MMYVYFCGSVVLLIFVSAVNSYGLPNNSKLFRTKTHTSKSYLSMRLPTGSNEDKLMYRPGHKVKSGFGLATNNFLAETVFMIKEGFDRSLGSLLGTPVDQTKSLGLVLAKEDVDALVKKRDLAGTNVEAHPISKTLYEVGCSILDNLFVQRPIACFWFLETVARIPYFSYTSMLHLYESLGWCRLPGLRKVHNAEEWNELHHLLIMESLGGNQVWSDRFLAYHVALLYYWALIVTYTIAPWIAYEFMELLETHAVDTYAAFVTANADKLKTLPAPEIAITYYSGKDLYLFDEFQINREPGTRRPPCDSLYDVFINIRDDEAEHVNTMRTCKLSALDGKQDIMSPHDRYTAVDDSDAAVLRRKKWNEWAEKMNEKIMTPTASTVIEKAVISAVADVKKETVV